MKIFLSNSNVYIKNYFLKNHTFIKIYYNINLIINTTNN